MTSTASAKAYKGMGMEGMLAKWYATNTRKSLDEFKTLARRIASELPAGSSVLEVAPGPGYFAVELAKLGNYRVTGLDISKTFVEIADRNAKEANVDVSFRQGNASDMPFERESFDFILCRAAFKNFADPVGALQEMYRVLKTGGRGLIIDLSKNASAGKIASRSSFPERTFTPPIYKTTALGSKFASKKSDVRCGADPLVRCRRPRRPARSKSGSWGPARTRGSAPPNWYSRITA
jgi:ubiquinone/menaquinone biosynthesis C-methylase UbiE